MKQIAIDVGTFSVKCIEYSRDAGLARIVRKWEYKLSNYPADTILERYEMVFDELFSELPAKSKVHVTLPSEMGVNRFLFLPIKSRKKAEQMVPFQIEEDIPYALGDAHLGMSLYSKDKGQMAHIGIVPKVSFDQYMQIIFSKWQDSLSITLDTAAYQIGLKDKLPLGPTCIIDIGHQTTKAHFFLFGKLVSTHKSYVAGKTITEAIAKNYNISLEDAELFKHEHCFVLSNDLIAESEVDHKQQVFAQLMNTTLAPLIQDIKRWILGFRMNFSQEIETIYLCGGGAEIQNIGNYITVLTHVRATPAIDTLIPECSSSYHLCYSLAMASKHRSELLNFMSGEYKRSMADEISVESISFIASRVGIVAAICLAVLFLEQVSLRMEIKKLDQSVMNKLKNPLYQITPKDLRQFSKKPEVVLNQLKNQKRTINQEVRTIQSTSNINAITPLVKLSKGLSKQEVNLISYDIDGDIKSANIKLKVLPEVSMDKIEKDIRDMGLAELKVNMLETDRVIEVSYAFE